MSPDKIEEAEARFQRALVELESRLKAGEREVCEQIFAEFPDIKEQGEQVIELIYTEYVALINMGDAVEPDELRRRFPDHVERLNRLFALDRLFAGSQQGRSTTVGAHDTNVAGVPLPAGTPPIDTIPDHELLEEIGRGGMGVVYKARQLSLDRTVAAKLILRAGLSGDDAVTRFRAEAQAAAQLRHPHIVSIHEVGEAKDSTATPYFTMDFIDGPSLEELVRRTPLSAERAARYVARIATAVAFAHHRGILHRDIKPSNVLLDSNDQPLLMDFGLAKQLDSDSRLTNTGAVIGTPSYMPPEQARGNPQDVGPSADVYALGAILYHLLTARPPFLGETVTDTLMQVVSDEPVPPRRLQPGIPRDLETICLTALRKNPAQRYASAEALEQDLERFLADKPVRARRIGPLERGLKWSRRHSGWASLIVACAVFLVAAVAAGIWYGGRLRSHLAVAEDQRDLANDRLLDSRRSSYVALINTADEQLSRTKPNVSRAREVLTSLIPAADESDLRGFEWYHLWARCHTELGVVKRKAIELNEFRFLHDGRLVVAYRATALWLEVSKNRKVEAKRRLPNSTRSVAVSRGGGLCVTGRTDGTFAWQPIMAEAAPATHKAGDLPIKNIDVSPDSLWVVTSDGSVVSLWKLDGRRATRAHTFAGDSEVTQLEFNYDGSQVAVVRGRRAGIYDVTSHRLLKTLAVEQTVTFSPRGSWLGWFQGGSAFRQSKSDPGKTHRHPRVFAYALGFSPSEDQFAIGSANSGLLLYDLKKKGKYRVFRGHESAVRRIEYSPNGNVLATANGQGTVRYWDPRVESQSWHRIQTEEFHPLHVYRICYSSDSSLVAFGGKLVLSDQKGEVLFCETVDGSVRQTIRDKNPITDLDLSPNQQYVVTCNSLGGGSAAKVWSVATGKALQTISIPQQNVHCGRFLNDTTLALGCLKGTIIFWNWKTKAVGRELRAIESREGREDPVTRLELSADRTTLLSHCDDSFAVWDVVSGEKIAESQGHVLPRAAAVSADGKLIGWPASHAQASSAVEASRSRLTTAGLEYEHANWASHLQIVSVRPAATRQVLITGTGLRCMDFSHDGRRILTGTGDSRVTLWDVTTGHELIRLPGHINGVTAVALSPDGKQAATADLGANLRLWRGLGE